MNVILGEKCGNPIKSGPNDIRQFFYAKIIYSVCHIFSGIYISDTKQLKLYSRCSCTYNPIRSLKMKLINNNYGDGDIDM